MIRTVTLNSEDRCCTIAPDEGNYFDPASVKAYHVSNGILVDLHVHEVGGVWNIYLVNPPEPIIAYGMSGLAILQIHLHLGVTETVTVTIEEKENDGN